MKKLLILLSVLFVLIICATAASAAVLSPAIDIISDNMEITVSAEKGKDATLDGEHLADAIGVSDFEKIKITSLPDEKEGTLYFGDVCVTEGQVIKKDALSELRFSPMENVESSDFGFEFDGTYSMTCSIRYTDKVNTAPKALSAPVFSVYTTGLCHGEMRGTDADGDSLFYEVVDYPQGGELKYDSKTGEFTYTAGSRVMNDSFTYRVKDSAGESSEIIEYTLSVRDNDSKTVFSDMDDYGCIPACVEMTERGYMTCSEKEGKLYFSPDGEVSRLDFLVMAMNVFGAGNIPSVTNSGFGDDEKIPEEYKGYVYSAAKLGIINGVSENGQTCFDPDRSITRAEATVILNNIIGYTPSDVECLAGVPEWAQNSVSAMYEIGIYDLDDGAAQCHKAVTKAEAATMLSKISFLIEE